MNLEEKVKGAEDYYSGQRHDHLKKATVLWLVVSFKSLYLVETPTIRPVFM